ncbi:YwmB family TATA-box binding protein [Virgibacillus salinus]|uniref:TATA-box binding n=1 Tax=Virgibacillus salinus TaxID=553311 RepID=A0A1H0YDL0_9BACI|nr:YwmB family TATA-box binding protein [Virgibacillus salinus]SDQ13359.1 TATA-box binding [Virgibacillus salinus]
MKKIVLMSIILLLTTGDAVSQKQQEEMSALASTLTGSDMEVENWEVTIKEQMSKDRVKQLIKKLKTKNSQMVTSKEAENSIKYSFGYINKKTNINETYNIVIPKDDKYQAQFTVVLEGNSWNKSIKKDYLNRLESVQYDFFSDNSTKFACITTTLSGKLGSVYFLNRIKESLNLQNIDEQSDTVENSMLTKVVYGYTPLWDQKITIMDKPMNLQLAFKDIENGKTKLTIGTPILITEY